MTFPALMVRCCLPGGGSYRRLFFGAFHRIFFDRSDAKAAVSAGSVAARRAAALLLRAVQAVDSRQPVVLRPQFVDDLRIEPGKRFL